MAGTLYVVATPIGNLEDITLRALRVLREVDVIAAEDTRRTARLLTHHGISTPMISFHEHNAHGRLPKLMERLTRGGSVAIVSDAGTPGVSDPGGELIEVCLVAGVTVDPVPGPSAPLAAVIGSGFPILPLTVFGFPPHRSNDRIRWLSELAAIKTTTTFFESPHRIARTLGEAEPFLGIRQIVLARELTKVHQEFLRGTAGTLRQRVETLKGEITVVLAPLASEEIQVKPLSDAEIFSEFGLMAQNRLASRGRIVSDTAKKLGLSRREVFAALERNKDSVK